MSDWRKDADLVRQDGDEEFTQKIDLEPRWADLFGDIERIFVGQGGGFVTGTWRVMFRGFLWQAKKRVAVDPDGARDYVTQSMQLICARLQIEPRELYPDLKPKEPDRVA